MARDTKEKILEAALDVFSKDGYDGANISDITQSVIKDYFAMIMLVETDELTVPFTEFADALDGLGRENGLEIHVSNEEIFNAMHRI